MDIPPVRLTSLAHGGGCGCKLDPEVLRTLLADQPVAGPFERLLVGNETADDAAVWALDDGTCLIATTDFFTPMVDDPHDFGRIAATNAISDVYAMGGKPILALAILGMPVGKIAPEIVAKILKGGAATCAEAGIPIAGGHSIDTPEPIYGLAVIGLADRARIRRNADAKAGDVAILTKPLGVGIYSAAIKREALDDSGYADFVATTTRLNKVGADLAGDADVHAITDITGFGLLGHGLELARGAGLTFVIEGGAIPLLPRAEALARDGFVTGASHRNWASFGDHVALPEDLPDWRRHILTDPQTSGGLLVTCTPERADAILAQVRTAGFAQAAIVGRFEAGPPGIRVEA
ncbi:selenide, water dikinase [Methylobacterium sp. Leaf125]|jgi:selenide,water dikinase|uniref:selenide, water dikinase SelD n=1 Tax=unclassified Methylobacterium TaxID=2615210 RepID=UPI0006F9C86D|nr:MULTISPECIES: selenide, water dikinase SelD [unclassified Methylobacterium]KQQ45171.1 selenide, water dikinase [Methylobacterium sp. Leaf125]MBX9934061.1 selenide, water dikinase SelD [Methylobacterium sp.]